MGKDGWRGRNETTRTGRANNIILDNGRLGLANIGKMIHFVDVVRSWTLFSFQDCGSMFMDVAHAIASVTHSSVRLVRN